MVLWLIGGMRRGRESNRRYVFEDLCWGGYGDGSIINRNKRSREIEVFENSVWKMSRVFGSNEFEGIYKFLVEMLFRLLKWGFRIFYKVVC